MFTTNFSVSRTTRYSKEALRTAFFKNFMTTEVQAKLLPLDALKPPFGNYREENEISPSRFAPCEATKNGVKTTVRVLVVTGEPEDQEDISEVVTYGVERYHDQVSAREDSTEKDLVDGYKAYTSGRAAKLWNQVTAEATITPDADGKYPEGTFIDLTAEWLPRLLIKPAMRDSYLAFLRAEHAGEETHEDRHKEPRRDDLHWTGRKRRATVQLTREKGPPKTGKEKSCSSTSDDSEEKNVTSTEDDRSSEEEKNSMALAKDDRLSEVVYHGNDLEEEEIKVSLGKEVTGAKNN